ncbi:flavin reductase family protein [Acidiferrimicrobium sp. IK]|uniref:flavin reductase family protein n=1 Tax=Acidiferrimicrobium sp. IK TaxID=2871700 RepID=UPI0021CB3429|nr:flavin reductase family protein [Acidiferrimicrobium sp. IK]MCU4184436.1 flavin reductase family protein [Acidiferrimicrobium sp. IK]
MNPNSLEASAFVTAGLHPVPVAVTTIDGTRTNGLITLSGGPASVVPEAPRVTVSITKYNFSHDMVLRSGVFTLHVLGGGPERLGASLAIIRALAGRSGRDGDKLGALRTRTGVTGAPVLLDALGYVEARVTGSLDNDENTIFVGDVVSAERLHRGSKLLIGEAWSALGRKWTDEYEDNHEAQINHCRVMRGLEATAISTD